MTKQDQIYRIKIISLAVKCLKNNHAPIEDVTELNKVLSRHVENFKLEFGEKGLLEMYRELTGI